MRKNKFIDLCAFHNGLKGIRTHTPYSNSNINNSISLIGTETAFIVISRFNKYVAGGGTRTHTSFQTTDFESVMATITSLPHKL